MIKNVVHNLLARRHHWRTVSFSELSELYTSMMLRSMGMSLIGIFVPIYLYKLGYPIGDICLYLALQYFGRIFYEIPVGYLIARIGPKHTMLISYIFQITSLVLLLTLPEYHWPLWLIALCWALASSTFFLAFHVDFSKVMHGEHGGKELGFLSIMERSGGVLGPVVGGIVATVFGPQYTILAAITMFLAAILPLLMSPEPTKLHQKLHFASFPFKKYTRDYASYIAYGAETVLAMSIWPLYLAIFLFTDNTYAQVGAVTSAGVLASIVAAYAIGKTVDARQGATMLNWSIVGVSLLHLVRPTIVGAGGVVLVNTIDGILATAFRIPYMKGYYGQADNAAGYRIVYIVVTEMINDIGKALPWALLWLLSMVLDIRSTLYVGFVMAAIAALLVTTQRFPALRTRLA